MKKVSGECVNFIAGSFFEFNDGGIFSMNGKHVGLMKKQVDGERPC
jgi:hypothetical protein